MKIVSVSEIIAIEKKANAEGLGYEQMMRNAGTSLADIVLARFGDVEKRHILGLAGSGNNGGDTLVALEALQKMGWETTAFLVKERAKDDTLILAIADAGGEVIPFSESTETNALVRSICNTSVILDGILGTGFKLPLRGAIPEVLQLTAKHKGNAHIIAVDCPSGVDCDSGECAPDTLGAEITVCMAAVKQGLVKLPAAGLAGEIVPAEIGLPKHALDNVENSTLMADIEMVGNLLPKRPADSHKGTFGSCMVAGGSVRYPGAPLLAAAAAYRVGAGLVCTAVPGAIYDGLISSLPESTWLKLPHELGSLNEDAAKVIVENTGKSNVILTGPGLGFDRSTKDFLETLITRRRSSLSEKSIGFISEPLRTAENKTTRTTFVIDADALRILPAIDKWQEKLESTVVLTPHPGEMAALTGKPINEIQADRLQTTKDFAQDIGHVVVLKGAVTVIASPQGETVITPFATPALATAGSGDVLAGMITGLIAQGLNAFDAAIAGSWLHGAAGLKAGQSHGQTASVIASDIIDQIPTVLKQITAR